MGLKSTFRPQFTIEYVRRGDIRLDPLVTHNLPLHDFQRALEIAGKRLEHAIKVSMSP